MHRPLVVLCAVLVVGCASQSRTLSRTAEPPAFLSPAQIVKRMEASAVQYRVEGKDSPPGGWAEQLWPLRVAPHDAPRVVEEKGERVVTDWPGNPPAVNALLDEAEPHFEARRYAEAGKLYEQATRVCPDCYLAWNFRGDAALFSGDPASALEHYRRAIHINPNDHRSWFFQGNALARLGRFKEALDSWAWCLVLNPRYAIIRDMFRNNAGLGLAILDDAIVPRGFASWEGESVSVQFDPDHDPSWLAFANCKALWLGEPSHRTEMTGSADERFSTLEEIECLGSALVVHGSRKAQEEQAPSDPSLERLAAITEDGMLTEAVLFEVGTRIHPQIVLTLDDDVRQRLKTYVLKHVLVAVPTAGGHDL